MKFRNECKHRINLADIMQLRTRLRAVARHDPHSDENGLYCVKSLYFDNYTDRVLREKLDGVDKREKFRIRYYGTDTSFMRLEKKTKINGMCHKDYAPLSAEQCEKILCGDIHFLLESEHNLLRELYAKMHYQLLRPKCIVMYERECFIYPPGNVRVTLDMNIRGSYNVREFLNPGLECLQLQHTAILEIKWDEYLPQIIRDAVQLKSRKTSSFSKYAAVRI